MKNLNYNALSAAEPTVYEEYTNSQGQKIKFVEHPTQGDLYPVIIMFDEQKCAVCSDFFDTDDMAFEGSDYEPIYQHGKMNFAFELGF